jgi:ABC-type glycerol-3-phosphate transport system permease component
LPLVVWIMRGFFEDLPAELEESAWMDGADRYGAFLQSCCRWPARAMVAASILSCNWRGTISLRGGADEQRDADAAGADGGVLRRRFRVDWGGLTASGVLVILPVTIFSFAAQRHLVPDCRPRVKG